MKLTEHPISYCERCGQKQPRVRILIKAFCASPTCSSYATNGRYCGRHTVNVTKLCPVCGLIDVQKQKTTVKYEDTAWNLIGWDDGPIRIKGGRTVYEAINYNSKNAGRCVKLAHLKVIMCADGKARIRQTNRYIDPDTIIEVLEKE